MSGASTQASIHRCILSLLSLAHLFTNYLLSNLDSFWPAIFASNEIDLSAVPGQPSEVSGALVDACSILPPIDGYPSLPEITSAGLSSSSLLYTDEAPNAGSLQSLISGEGAAASSHVYTSPASAATCADLDPCHTSSVGSTSLIDTLPPFSTDADLDTSPFKDDDQRWGAVLARDQSAVGHFVYCVKSTKIFCRPTCPSRRPLRANVLFFDTIEQSLAQGFRACKRCKPDELADPAEVRQMVAVEQVKRLLLADNGQKGSGIKQISRAVGMSTWHLHRIFKRRVGETPEVWRRRNCGIVKATPSSRARKAR